MTSENSSTQDSIPTFQFNENIKAVYDQGTNSFFLKSTVGSKDNRSGTNECSIGLTKETLLEFGCHIPTMIRHICINQPTTSNQSDSIAELNREENTVIVRRRGDAFDPNYKPGDPHRWLRECQEKGYIGKVY